MKRYPISKTLAPSSAQEDVPPVYNLMDALKKSVEQGKRSKPASGGAGGPGAGRKNTMPKRKRAS